jgi:hypothetical protein
VLEGVEDRRKQRLQFLHELYRLTNGNENAYANMYDIGKTYNFDNESILSCTQYLEGEGLLKSQALGGRIAGLVGITHIGVKEVEGALINPQSSTKYFPPASAVHIINVQTMTMTNSQIVQGGSDNIFGKNIVIGSGTINVSEQQLARIPNEYAESLRAFSENINKQLEGSQIPQEQVDSLKQSINNLAKELEDIRPGKEQEIDEEKRVNIEARTTSVIQRVLNVLPQTIEVASTFTPLSPFSKVIGKGVQEIVDAIQKRKKK